jgi:hypothetical protein
VTNDLLPGSCRDCGAPARTDTNMSTGEPVNLRCDPCRARMLDALLLLWIETAPASLLENARLAAELRA